ncbi:Yip1-domain-containing protein [Stereum hirsutum FP-91666 SS1]|uniref:Yip1-domain-containing protein n=1 Tax=Stereum hirsutum (strain FP-91666) TaxID=721885 RepID=UPI000440A3CC|nr:Yip1-domain-containing protein [Stereum hirsutum FP-91666 SS1]EIM87379.1 Yip1-domain-containing protein [Stereum hirsutum FP-91666 SS1]
MAYVSVESDDRLEDETPQLEYKSFLGDESANTRGGHSSRGYIADQPRSSSFWSLDYYQSYFDIDTKTVLSRCLTTLYPLHPSYTSAHLVPSPDLYGPFWTLTTLIFTLFITSSLASSIVAYLSSQEVDYDFALLSTAVGLVYAYGMGVPVLLWGVLRYWGVGGAGEGMEGWGLVEALGVWGYGMFVWIPVSILCVIPIALVRWILTGIAFAFSGYFLVANVYPVLASTDNKSTRLLIILIAALHAGIALAFKVLFFSYYVVDLDVGPADPVPPVEGEVPRMLMRFGMRF